MSAISAESDIEIRGGNGVTAFALAVAPRTTIGNAIARIGWKAAETAAEPPAGPEER